MILYLHSKLHFNRLIWRRDIAKNVFFSVRHLEFAKFPFFDKYSIWELKSVSAYQILSESDRGRPRKTWSACVRNDMTICNLDGVNPLDKKQEFMENECEALPGVAYPGVRDNRSTLNTKTGYDDDEITAEILR